MKCAECRDEIMDDSQFYIQGREKTRRLFFCSRRCKWEYLRHVLGDNDFKELNFDQHKLDQQKETRWMK